MFGRNNLKCSVGLLLICALAKELYAAKILGLVPFPCKSHSILGSTLLKALAARGHKVTMISSFPLDRPTRNYRDIYVDIERSKRAHKSSVAEASGFPLLKAYSALQCCTKVNEAFLEDENVRKFLAGGEKFDLVITLGKDSLLGISHAVNATTIRFNMLEMHSIYSSYTMNPLPSSYVPNFLLPYSSNMGFLQRVLNTVMNLFFDLCISYVWMRQEAAVVRKHFPDAPRLEELQSGVDLTFVNSHMAVDAVRPHMSNVIPIGGFHITNNNETLSDELKHFLDAALEGVILFSMGSSIKSEVLQDKLNDTLRCFAKLPYKILWKNEDDAVPGQPDNVKSFSWLPQKAVLAHPHVKLFITHGGLGSVLESVYYAVPMVVIPIYLDQHKNAAQSSENGFAIRLDADQLTEDTLRSAIDELLTNPKYSNEVRIRSNAFKHQEVDPMEKAIYWVEHVIEHRGANHLKTKRIPLLQYYLLDVYGFLLISLISLISLVAFVAMKVYFMYKCVKAKLAKIKTS